MDYRRHQSRELYNISRFQSMLLINYNGKVLKAHMTDPKELIKFVWEESPEVKKQTLQEIKSTILTIATIHNAKEGKRNIDDPPTILAPKYRK